MIDLVTLFEHAERVFGNGQIAHFKAEWSPPERVFIRLHPQIDETAFEVAFKSSLKFECPKCKEFFSILIEKKSPKWKVKRMRKCLECDYEWRPDNEEVERGIGK
jgi:hypothetical protein